MIHNAFNTQWILRLLQHCPYSNTMSMHKECFRKSKESRWIYLNCPDMRPAIAGNMKSRHLRRNFRWVCHQILTIFVIYISWLQQSISLFLTNKKLNFLTHATSPLPSRPEYRRPSCLSRPMRSPSPIFWPIRGAGGSCWPNQRPPLGLFWQLPEFLNPNLQEISGGQVGASQDYRISPLFPDMTTNLL